MNGSRPIMGTMALPPIQDAPREAPYSPDLGSLKLPAVQTSTTMRSPPQLPTLEPLPSLSLTLSNSTTRDPFVKLQSGDHAYAIPRAQNVTIQQRGSMVSTDSSSPTEVGSTMSYDDYLKRKDTNTTVDETDDRIAAEALCGLGHVDSRNQLQDARPPQEQEPLLSLLSNRHPWIGGTINNSISAYASIKQFSPRPVQYGAALVESTVGHIGRGTGVEGNIRRYLGGENAGSRHDEDVDRASALPAKRRRTEGGLSEEALSHLPAAQRVDTNRHSFDGTRDATVLSRPVNDEVGHHQVFRPSEHRSWSTQLLISTSGLGAAFNEASLRSLRYCLNFIRATNEHINGLVRALRSLLSELQGPSRQPDPNEQHRDDTPRAREGEHNQAPPRVDDNQLSERIRQLNDEIWNTVKSVCTNISRYTGGALPESAGQFVRMQVMSVPARWQRTAPQQTPTDSRAQTLLNGQRMVAFANEGLDMMGQVHGVVDETIQSAEKWLDRVGRRTSEQDRHQLEHGVGDLQLGRSRHEEPTPLTADSTRPQLW